MKYKKGDKVKIIGNNEWNHNLEIGQELDVVSTDGAGVKLRGYCPATKSERAQYVAHCDIELVQDKIYWP